MNKAALRALRTLASFPIEASTAFRRDDAKIYGFNDWVLTVADVKAARRALAELEQAE